MNTHLIPIFCGVLIDLGVQIVSDMLEGRGAGAAAGSAIIMLLSMKFHVPELVTGLIGIAFIGWALLASLKHRKQEAKNIIT